MDEILLYLSLKHAGQWMAIYDSLNKREQLSVREVEKAVDEVDCSFITLIDNKYVENLKSIYKPPFGVFCYGNYNLLCSNCLTVYADDSNDNFIRTLQANKVHIIWPNLSTKEMVNVLKKYKTNNIFYMPEVKNASDKAYQNLLVNQDVIFENAFFSEIWERKSDIDYSAQLPERLYLGISKKVLILRPLSSKELYSLANYCKNEDISVYFLESVFDAKVQKLFANSKVVKISSPEDLTKITFGAN